MSVLSERTTLSGQQRQLNLSRQVHASDKRISAYKASKAGAGYKPPSTLLEWTSPRELALSLVVALWLHHY